MSEARIDWETDGDSKSNFWIRGKSLLHQIVLGYDKAVDFGTQNNAPFNCQSIIIVSTNELLQKENSAVCLLDIEWSHIL